MTAQVLHVLVIGEAALRTLAASSGYKYIIQQDSMITIGYPEKISKALSFLSALWSQDRKSQSAQSVAAGHFLCGPVTMCGSRLPRGRPLQPQHLDNTYALLLPYFQALRQEAHPA